MGEFLSETRNYELQVYVCEGSDSEKLAWFRTINIAGQTLTDQEIRNAMYVGPWLADAKRYFSGHFSVSVSAYVPRRAF